MVPACQFLTILTSKSLSRAGVVQILSTSWTADPSHHLAFRTYLCEPSKPRNYGKTQHFAQFLPAKTSLLSNIDAARATGNFQYSRKLELLNFLWWVSWPSVYLYAIYLRGGQVCSQGVPSFLRRLTENLGCGFDMIWSKMIKGFLDRHQRHSQSSYF